MGLLKPAVAAHALWGDLPKGPHCRAGVKRRTLSSSLHGAV